MPTSSSRILCLHGYAQNARMFEGKLTDVRRALGERVELVFVDAPNILVRPTLSSQPSSESDAPSTGEPRSWWQWSSNQGFGDLKELDRVISYLRQVVETQGPFDGIFGFSMGAAAAALLTALLERPAVHPIFAAPAQNAVAWPPPPFRFAVLCNAYLPGERMCWDWFSPPTATPSLHVLGRGDVVVDNEWSSVLVSRFSDPQVAWHGGGHHIPRRKPALTNLIRSFILSHAKHTTTPSPSSSPSSSASRLSFTPDPTTFPFIVIPIKVIEQASAMQQEEVLDRKMRELSRKLQAETEVTTVGEVWV
ncbi:hypothetical protein JCM11641_003461 [Rhodosporidiobolus odoratus]